MRKSTRPYPRFNSLALLSIAGGLILVATGCGGSYASPYVSCSTARRHFDLEGARHGPATFLGAASVENGPALYAEGRSGRVYVSRSRGSSWQRFGRGVEGVPCALVAIDPRRPTLMFATNGDELARTTDAGRHWTTLKLPRSARATGVAIAPSDDRVVYAWGFAGGHGGLTPGPPPGGLFRSNDGGATWKKIADYEPSAIGIAPSAPDTVLVTTEAGLYQTTDGGGRWTELHTGLPHPYGHSDNYDAVAISPSTPSRAFADGESDRQMGSGPYDGQFTTIVFRTTNSGAHWSASLRLINTYDIAFAPRSSAIAYVTGDQANAAHTAATRFHLFRTSDSGQHWVEFTGEALDPSSGHTAIEKPKQSTVQELLVDPRTPSILYADTSDGRLARSLNSGQTWSLLPPLPNEAPR